MFSDSRIVKLAEQFVCVKVDPRVRSEFELASDYKSTRYVPEVVFLDSRGEVVDRLEDRSVEGAAATMERVLKKVKR